MLFCCKPLIFPKLYSILAYLGIGTLCFSLLHSFEQIKQRLQGYHCERAFELRKPQPPLPQERLDKRGEAVDIMTYSGAGFLYDPQYTLGW